MAVLVSRADLLVLGLVDTARETARYELAVRTIDGTAFATLALSAPTVFLLTRRLSAGDRDGAQRAFALLHRWLVVAGVGLTAVLVPLAEPLATFAYGSSYRSVGAPLAILGALVWAMFVLSALGALLTSSEDPARVLPLGLAMLAVNAVLVAALLPPFGAVGAALATVGTQAVGLVLYARTALRLTGVRTPLPDPRVAAAGLAAGLGAWIVRDGGLPVALVTAAALYAVGLVALRAVRADDVRDLRARLGRA
jgi:O-antigen/teichoic acid export membrane protein